MVTVPNLPTLVTQTRRLDQVESRTREAIALLLELPSDSFDLALEISLPADLQATQDRVFHLRERAGQAEDEARRAERRVHELLAGRRRRRRRGGSASLSTRALYNRDPAVGEG